MNPQSPIANRQSFNRSAIANRQSFNKSAIANRQSFNKSAIRNPQSAIQKSIVAATLKKRGCNTDVGTSQFPPGMKFWL
jgi:hypothetical protein